MVRNEEETGGGLSERIAKDVIKQLSEQGKKPDSKDFKLPFSKRLGEKGKIKKNFALVGIIKTNGNWDWKWLRIKEDLIYLKESDTYHSATAKHVGYYKKYPVLVIPEWDLEPLCRETLYKQAEEGKLAKAQTVIIHNIMKAEGLLKGKKSFGSSIIWILLIAGIGYLAYTLLSKPNGN